MTRTFKAVAAALLAAAAGCAHGPTPLAFTAGPDAPAWPPPPASPRVRFAGSWPDPQADAAARGWFTRAFDAIAGIDPSRPQRLLSRPFGLAVRGGELLVADPDGRRVLHLDVRTGEVAPLLCADREWVSPMAVAFGEDRATYVADPGAGAVLRLEGDKCRELGRGRLERPTGLALAGGRLYVVDPPRHQLAVFSLDGAEVSTFGARGDDEGQLNFPTGVSAAPDGTLLVVDSLNFRIVRFSGAGLFLGAFGEAGDGPGEFARPKAVSTDGLGRAYVSDSTLDQVLVFDPRGAFLYAFGATNAAAGLLMPAGLAVSGRFLYVADSLNGRVAIYELLGEAS